VNAVAATVCYGVAAAYAKRHLSGIPPLALATGSQLAAALVLAGQPADTISVTFLIPVFGVLWGWWFLGERVTLRMGAGCAVILLGTALTTGMLKLRKRHTAHA
jgi:drug/metabolite transporter (DMT)-like permease